MLSEKSKGWICLLAAGLLEIVWAYFLKQSQGFSVLLPTVIVVICLVLSFFLLGKAMMVFGIGLSYGVFTGIGIAGTTIVGILFLYEGISLLKIVSLLILLSGLIGLKVISQKEAEHS